MGKNDVIFGADMSSTVHNNNKGKDILILGEELTQGLDDTTLTAESKYPINFTQPNKTFVCTVMDTTKTYQFKIKNFEIKDYALTLGNISKDFTIDNMKKNRIKRSCKIFFCWFLILLILTIF